MKSELSWVWNDDAYYRAMLNAARVSKQNTVLHLPAEPGPPMSVVVSSRLAERVLAPLSISNQVMQSAVLRGCEELLVTYAGVDLGATVLIDFIRLAGLTEAGLKFSIPTHMIWEAGVFGIFSAGEIALADEFFVERQLLLTELRHRCESLEE